MIYQIILELKDLIITIADNGFLIILDKKNGKLVRSTNIKTKIKNKKWDDLVNNGFLVGKNKIYLSTNGKLNIIDLSSAPQLSSGPKPKTKIAGIIIGITVEL